MNANLRNLTLWAFIALLLLALFTLFQNQGQQTSAPSIPFSQLLTEVDNGRVREVVIQGSEIRGSMTDGRRFQSVAPNDPTLITQLSAKGITVSVQPSDPMSWLVSLMASWLPFLVLIGVWIFLSRRMKNGAAVPAGQNPADAFRHMQNEIDALKRVIADQQAQIDRLSIKDR
jgi:cell division protease FtsH